MKKITIIAVFFIVCLNSCKKENIMKPANQSPVAFAGTHINVILPVTFVELTGKGTDPDGTIVSFQWTKISGPSQYFIVTPNSKNTEVQNLVEGTYVFELKVTDDGGLSGKAKVIVDVLRGNPGTNTGPGSGAGNWDY